MALTSLSDIKSLFLKTYSNDRVSSDAYLTSFPLSRTGNTLGGLQGIVFELYGKRSSELWDTQRVWLKIKSDKVGYQTFYNEANVNGKNVEYSFGLHTNKAFTDKPAGSASGDNFNLYHWFSQTGYGSSTSTSKPTYAKLPDITAYIKYKDTGFIGIGGTTSDMELTIHSYDSVILSAVKDYEYDGENINVYLSSKPSFTPNLIEIGPESNGSADLNNISYDANMVGYKLPVSIGTANNGKGYYGTLGSVIKSSDNHPEYNYFNDEIHYTVSTASKVTDLAWDDKHRYLSWTPVTNAKSYYIYIDDEFYTETEYNYISLKNLGLYGDHKISIVTKRFLIVNNYTREYSQGFLTPTSSISTFTTRRIANISCYDESAPATITATFRLSNPSISLEETDSKTRRDTRAFYVISNSNRDPKETLYYRIDNGSWVKTSSGSKVTINNLSLGEHTIQAYAKSSDGTSTDSGVASTTFTTTVFRKPFINTSTRGNLVDSWNITWGYNDTKFANPDYYNVYLNGKLYETGGDPNGETIAGLLFNTTNKIEIEAVLSNNSEYNNRISLDISANQLPILATPIITELPATYETIEIIDSDGNVKKVQSKTALNFSFTKVNRAVAYDLHDIYQGEDIGGPVLDVANGRFSISLSNAINSGEHKFYISASAGENKSDWDSAPGNYYVLSVTKYLKPSIIKVDNEGNHDPFSSLVRIDGNLEETHTIDYFKIIPEYISGEDNFSTHINVAAKNNTATVNLYSFLKNKLAPCKANFTVYAMSYDTFRYEESISSASTSDGGIATSVIYETIKLETPKNLKFDSDLKVFDWSDVENVYNYFYDVKRDSVTIESGIVDPSQASVQVILDSDSFYQFFVTAKGNPITSNPKYIDSETALLGTGVVSSPKNFRRDGSRLYWEDEANANNYNIYKNGEFWTNTKAKTFDISNLGLGTYVISIKALRNVTNQNEIVTIYSNEVFLEEFTISQLESPVIEFENSSSSKLNWTNVNNASYFMLYYGGKSVKINANVQFYSHILTLDNSGEHNVYIEVHADDEFIYRKNLSNTLTYSVVKLDTVENIKYHSSGDELYGNKTLSWNAVDGANGYLVELNGTVYTSTLNYMILTDSQVKYDNYVTVIATDLDRRDDSRPRYLDSEVSAEYHFGKLQTPILVLEENVLHWKKYIDPYDPDLGLVDYTGADYFEIYDTDIYDVNGNTMPIMRTTNSEYILSSLYEKTFKIYVKAFSDSTEMENSDISDYIVYTFTKLRPGSNEDKFALSLDTDNILSWDTIPNADYYEVYINDYLRYNVTASRCDITAVLRYGSGEYEFTVIAKSNKVNYIASDPSYVLRKYIVPNFQYSCVIEDETFALNTPINLKITASEELDTGNISFISTKKDEYKAYTPITINLYPNESYEGSTEIIYNMIVEKDHVKEIQQGEKCVYEHDITLIELTKKLQTEFISGLAVTQPLAVVQSLYSRLAPAYTGYPIPTTQEKLFDGIRLGNTVGEFAELTEIYGWGRNENLSMKSSYKFGEDIRLPHNTGEYYLVRQKSVGFEDKWGITDILDEYLGDVATDVLVTIINWLLIPGSVVINTSWSFLGGWVGALLHDLIFAKYKETRHYLGKRTYQFVLHDDNKTDIDLYNMSSYNAVFTKQYNDNKSHSITFEKGSIAPGRYDIIYTIEGAGQIDVGFDEINLGGMYDYPTKSFKPFKIVIRDIGIGMEEAAGQTSVPEAIARVIKSISPRYIDGSEEIIPEYTFDSSGIPGNMICPQYTFKDNNSLWEALLTIGRNFNGIPRLKKNNVIGFDILSEMTNSQMIIEDTSEPEEIISDMDNYASGFVSNISNLTSDTSYDYFPSKSGWVSPRSTNIMDPAVTKVNMGLVLPQKINYVDSIWVKTPSGKEFDISNFLYEKTVFNALNNNKAGKGTAIYYERGTNYIQGLATISENTELAATIGTDDTNYAIINILDIYFGNELADGDRLKVQDFQYRVKYKPLVDTRIFTEQANLSDMPSDVYMNLNQEDSALSDANFGKSAQTQLSRIGNNNIYKGYADKNFLNIKDKYVLGSIKQYNGYDYYADIVALEINKHYYTASMSFSKHFNKINPRVGVSSEYRTYDIPTKDIVNRTLNINNYCYISTKQYTDIQQNEMVFKNGTLELTNDLYKAFSLGKPNVKKTAFYMTSLDKDFKPIEGTSGMLIPASYHIFNNSISYSGVMLDHVAAGVNAYETVNAVNLKTAKYIQNDVLYTKSNGTLPIIKLALCNPTISELKDTSISGYDLAKYYPRVVYKTDPSKLSGAILSNKYFVEKDRREVLGFNYQLHFQTFDKRIGLTHTGLVEYLYRGEDDNESRANPKWYAFKSQLRSRDQITPASGKYVGEPKFEKVSWKGIHRNTIDEETKYGIKINSLNISADSSYKYLALVWPDTGEIILDYTLDENEKTTPELYFNFSNKKVDYKSE